MKAYHNPEVLRLTTALLLVAFSALFALAYKLKLHRKLTLSLIIIFLVGYLHSALVEFTTISPYKDKVIFAILPLLRGIFR